MARRNNKDINVWGISMESLHCAFSVPQPHISIGYGLLGDLNDIPDENAMQENFARFYPEMPPEAMKIRMQETADFMFRMKPGDVVVLADSEYTKKEHYGVITSPYYYGCHFGQDHDYMHHRDVLWLKKGSIRFGKPVQYPDLDMQSRVWLITEKRRTLLSYLKAELDNVWPGLPDTFAAGEEHARIMTAYGRAYKPNIPALFAREHARDPQAMVEIGVCYEYGISLAWKPQLAVEFYKQAAGLGNAEGQYHLGFCYSYGHGVPMDKEAGAWWYLQAARNGSPRAQCMIADCIMRSTGLDGIGTTSNPVSAMKWFEAAALAGHPIGEYKYSECCKYGLDGYMRPDLAMTWNDRYCRDEQGEKPSLI
ncbi:MAG: hypothetical protein LUE27_06060 [Clostridia bacterium]|nr:hypothetical protein [Clostridia bacterium]